MPADGRRKKVVQGVVTAIKAATGADYFNDLSPAGVCEMGRETDASMAEGRGSVIVRVFDGTERTRVNGANDYTAELDVLVACAVRDSTPKLVERLCDLMADLNLALGRGAALGGSCTTIRIGSIDAPKYDEDVAYTVVHVAATYDYIFGTDR